MHLILLGAPGAGKGTQGALLSKRLGVPKIATGDILREAVRNGTDLGRQAKGYMDAGKLVPDAVIFGLVGDALRAPAAARGAVFDGFPRTMPQAEAVDRILADLDSRVSAVVMIQVAADEIVERMSGRRTDPETGAVYHLTHNPPPADVAGRVVQRPDDEESTVRHRLSVYRETTEPLVAHYEGAGVPIHRIDGSREIEQVHHQILSALDVDLPEE